MLYTPLSVRLLAVFFLGTLFGCGPKPSRDTSHPTPVTLGPEASATASGPQLLPTPLPNDPLGVTIHRLSNGLTVYISTDRTIPSITSWIAVRAGSRHDPPNSTGLAHYLEHMLFKGSRRLGTLDFAKEKKHLDRIANLYAELRQASTTKQRAHILGQIDSETQAAARYAVPNEFDNLYAAMGINGVNAFTSDERTVYTANVPTNRFESWATIEGDRFANPQFRLFYPELESVYEEKNRSLDSPTSRVFEALSLGLYPTHPYGTQPTIGHADHLKTPAYADMVEYFDTWYRPNNMAILLAGDIDAQEALPILERSFSSLQPKALPALPEAEITPPPKRVETQITAPGERSVYLAWHTVPAGHPDEMALRAMDLLMDNSATGLLNIDLVLSQKLPRASSFGQHLIESGLWAVSGTARDDQSLADVEKLLLTSINKLKAGAFTQKELDAVVLNTEIADKQNLESNRARVYRMTDAFIEGRPWTQMVAQSERLRAVTREDVIRVAKQFLNDAPVVVRRERGEFEAPKVDKPKITAIPIDSSRESAFAKELKAKPIEPLAPQWLVEKKHYQISETKAGKLISVHNLRNDLFAIDYDFDFGDSQRPLICFGLELLKQSGAGSLSATQLQKALYSLGSSVSFACSPRTIHIHLSGLDENMGESIKLLTIWLHNPKLDAKVLKDVLANALSKRKDAMNEPSTITTALFEYALRGKDSDFLKVPSNQALTKADVPTLQRLVTTLPQYPHRTSYFGPQTDTLALAQALSLGEITKQAPRRSPILYKKAKKPTIYFVHQGVAQAQVRFAHPAKELPADQRLHAQLFREYVGGGMGSLVYQEVREARGLAYRAWATFVSPRHKGDDSALAGGLGTQADKTNEAVHTLLGLIDPLRVEPDRFATAVAGLDAAYRNTRIDPRTRASTVASWFDLGLDSDPRPTEYNALGNITSADLESFAKQHTKVPVTIAITGDEARIDLSVLAKQQKGTKVRKVLVTELFGY